MIEAIRAYRIYSGDLPVIQPAELSAYYLKRSLSNDLLQAIGLIVLILIPFDRQDRDKEETGA